MHYRRYDRNGVPNKAMRLSITTDELSLDLNSALEIRRKLSAYNLERASKGGLGMEFGTGIATGRVVAGYAGTQTRATYICVGDPVNLSARLESHTKVAGKPILIDENTRKALDVSIQVESLGEQLFKGKTMPVHVFSVTPP